MNQEETIAAVATAAGEGGIAVIRISGKEAIAVADRIFSGSVKNYLSHTAHFGFVKNLLGEKVDEALLMVMKAPKSYTGEDTVEIQCHGGSFVSSEVLKCVLQAGARMAHAGEFTFRAFMNGKLDLAKAESVQTLIAAKNARALTVASRQLEGALSKKIQNYKEELLGIAAIFEAWVDYPEEGLEFASFDEVLNQLKSILASMEHLSSTFHEGRALHQGVSLCLVGAPNAGKSSLMNALLGFDRAIVTEHAGTTRDLLEEELKIGDLSFRLVDSAGVRESFDLIEQEGVRRAHKAREKADIVLFVIDCQKGVSKEVKALLSTLEAQKTILVWNKVDIADPHPTEFSDFLYQVKVSALKEIGIDALKETLLSVVFQGKVADKEEVILTHLRHYEALCLAIGALKKVIQGLEENVSAEFLSFDMREALRELGVIVGIDVTEDILSKIFSTFCVGK